MTTEPLGRPENKRFLFGKFSRQIEVLSFELKFTIFLFSRFPTKSWLYINSENAKYVELINVIAKSLFLAKMTLLPPGYQVAQFLSSQEAREWLRRRIEQFFFQDKQ